MGKLYNQMLMTMKLRNFSLKTIESYTHHIRSFYRLFEKPPDQMGSDEIKKYLYYLKEEKDASFSNLNIARCALKFLYQDVLGRKWDSFRIPSSKKERRLPQVLSREEVKALLNAIENFKHKVIIMTIYSAGLRLGETTHLKVSDIDSKRMQIRVEQGKGKKDRYTLLSSTLLKDLRDYYRGYRPLNWLFPGRENNRPINESSVQRIFTRAKKKPVLKNQPAFIPFAIALPPIF
jgi:integrase/recombinase XerD